MYLQFDSLTASIFAYISILVLECIYNLRHEYFFIPVDIIVQAFTVLESCLADGKLRSSTREKSRSLFHAVVTGLNVPSMSPQLTRKVFQLIMDRRWPEKKCQITIDANIGRFWHTCIYLHIGGSMIYKLGCETQHHWCIIVRGGWSMFGIHKANEDYGSRRT